MGTVGSAAPVVRHPKVRPEAPYFMGNRTAPFPGRVDRTHPEHARSRPGSRCPLNVRLLDGSGAGGHHEYCPRWRRRQDQYHSGVTTARRATLQRTLREAARGVVEDALRRAVETGRLPAMPEAASVEVAVSRPANPEHGDLATNIALRLARPLRMAPPAIAA